MSSVRARLRGVLPDPADLAAMGRTPRSDLVAGLTVAIVALPLALGFGISSGMGAESGLATAVVAGALAAVFGGSRVQVTGTSGAMTVILMPIMSVHGPAGVLTVGALAGLLLIGLALARAGRYIALVPAPVVAGFTVGVACVIGLQQLPSALGVEASGHDKVAVVAWHALLDFLARPHWWAMCVTLGVAAVLLVGASLRPTVPFSLLAVVVATVVAEAAELPLARIGDMPAGLPAPSFAFFDPAALPSLLAPAVAVAALAALESLLSASVTDGMTRGPRHDPDRELFGQGLANLVTPLFGGMPGTGAMVRTAVNVRSGARSRLAALSHAAILAAIVCTAAGLVSKIPLAALAGVLLATSIRMIEVDAVRAMFRSTRADAVVLVLTAVATLTLDTVLAIIVGFVVAGALALRTLARNVRLDAEPLRNEAHLQHTEDEHALLAEHIVTYRLAGPLFFAAAHRFLLELSEVTDVSVVVLRMSRVTTIDASGALVLGDAIERLERRGILVYVSGIPDGHHQPLEALGVIARLDEAGQVFATTTEAIAAARDRLRSSGILPRLAG
ncbi:SulP family inorganic anion transporter [Actinomadura sp. ATCC 31491]|uniref:SulP family inorganic anion transporter n=1 Tax=Actinomadura luzonensis TaxID=2805427 RepID=A0ABT0FVF4_9ACTN|nr:SulP family inorganic anion transporter [Actinomadura luzonensis]MCK2216312.1 SulP family inorganic anion transporter [Actinomadura luzonensis]